MSHKKRILAMTATRSDYDLLSYLYKLLAADPDIDFRLLVSGTHLSKTYGYSVKEIEHDMIPILTKIETLFDSDSKAARLKSAALLMENSLHSINDFSPEVVIFCADREDAIAGALIATYLQIPGVHFFGGDHASDGHIDHSVRHATSKLSTAHFVSTLEHKERLLKMGEPPSRIFQIGSPAIDKLIAEKHMSKDDLKIALGLKGSWPQKYALLTYHPMSNEEAQSGQHMEDIITSLKTEGYAIFCNSPNVDSGSKEILSIINKYQHTENFYKFQNLPRETFVNLMRNADLMIGNSSAGVVEAASCKIKVINVGQRQRGRYSAGNVIFCDNNKTSILQAFEQIKSPAYLQLIQSLENPYGDGQSSQRAYEIIKTHNFKDILAKKEDPLSFSVQK
ncbi:UDP-N-acetylglucosamine 2-epimerase [Bdellovibrio svalbardensis]|uniref:UDP-N-acetylglucosamine 2-epimerase n=1 Tax=Bdellovibrio svalbardensis TaxID=2972972 RepID=A0ABT6DLF7_9BACT|nr:UDP-N-acetylglucosamine 2-epimerase [Bdellovibrio svalbardensis]MDG0817352.1 UDP-N-acetylglucosamine 2-epimerase [Bdellovibrio svalbardensis]